MREPPIHLLEHLASLSEQRRYVIGATKDEYLLPSELLGDAWHFCERARRPEIWATLTAEQRLAVEMLEQAINAARLEGYGRSNVADLIEVEPTWAAARQQAGNTLRSFGMRPPD
jgi:hypothetical protein